MPAPQPLHKEFDKVTHLRDKHGNEIGTNHYAYWLIDANPYFERPIGSGNLFLPNGEPCGRMLDRRKLTIDSEARHIEFVPPPTGAEQFAVELDSARSESEELRRELAALKVERLEQSAKAMVEEAKAQPVPSKFAAHAAEKKG